MKLAFLTTDNREGFREYDDATPWFGKAPEALLQGFPEIPGLEVHVLSCTQEPMKSSPEKLADNIYFHSVLAPKMGWMRTGFQGCIRAIRKKLRDIRPDIVHGQGTERDCGISAVFSGYPNVITVHGKMTAVAKAIKSPIGSYNWCAARVEDFTLPRTDGIICISDYVKQFILHYGVPFWEIPNAMQKMFYDFPRTVQPREVPQLINVGVISERKRQRQTLEVLCALRKEGINFETLFVGAPGQDKNYAP